MVIVAFQPGEKYAVNYTTLDQYDYGQVLRIQGLKLPKTVEVHFSTQETGGTSIPRIGVTKDGVTDVLIPDSVLENGDTTQNYSIFAFVYITDATSGKTEYRARLEVKARPKPEIPGGGDNPDIFHEAVLEVRKSAEKAEEAQRQAEGWAHGREDLPERAEDNAMHYAGKASEDAKKTAQDKAEVERLTESNTQIQGEVAKDLEEVKKLSSQAQASATNAALSEQKSKEAATRAETAQTGAETAEDNAELAAQKTGQDKTAVEQAKKLVQQMSQEVLDNKNAVDKTAQDFALKAQQALADVNNAGQAQTERVQTAGTTAVENIENAQNTATQAVETAKSEAIKVVQTEGTTQTGAVTAEGEKQVQAVQTAAQEIVADREQIAKNKTDIADLRQNKADAIVETASGNPCNISGSSGLLIKKLNIYGESMQEREPSPETPVPIVSKEISKITVTGKELEKQEITLSKSITLRGLHISSGGNATIDGKQYISDVIKDKDGIVGIEKCAKEITFDGTEAWYTWGKNPNGNIGFYFYYNQATTEGNYITSKDTLLSNYLQYVDNAFSGNGIGVNTSPANDDLRYIYIIVSLKQSDLKDVTTNELAVTSFKEFLSKKKTNGVPFTMICPLNIPIFEPLPQADQDAIKKLKTYYPNTVINTGAWTEIEYIADTKEFLLSQNKNLQKQILDIQNALISQKISGGGIKVTNSAKLPIVKLSVFGKSEQITTTGANLFNALTITEKHWLNTENGNIEPASTFWTSDFIEVEEGDYCLTEKGTNRNCGYDEGKNFVKPLLASKGKITVTSGIKFIRVSGVYETIKPNNLMINRGSTTKPYEPYTGGKPSPSPEYPQEITSCGENGNVKIDVTGKNLLNIEGETSEIRGDYEIFDNKITTITKDGYAGSYLMFSEKIPKGKYRFTCNKTKKGVKQNNKVLLSVKAKTDENGAGNSFNSYYKEWLIVEYLKKDILFETFEDFQIGLPLAGDDDKIGDEIIFENVMLMREDLDLTSAYEPYKKIQAFTLSTPNGLLGLKVNSGGNYTDETGQQWICDEIDLARGKYVQKIEKRILDGSEALADNIGSSTSYFLKVNDARSNTGMCNYGKRIPITGQKQEELTFSVDDSGIYLYTTKAVNEFKNLLKQKYDSGKPVEVLYALKTPIETDLPPEALAAFDQLHTNYPNTIVSNNADVGMELTYTVDTQSYIDGKIATLSKAIL